MVQLDIFGALVHDPFSWPVLLKACNSLHGKIRSNVLESVAVSEHRDRIGKLCSRMDSSSLNALSKGTTVAPANLTAKYPNPHATLFFPLTMDLVPFSDTELRSQRQSLSRWKGFAIGIGNSFGMNSSNRPQPSVRRLSQKVP
jgi:hypothetical protein